MPLGRTDLGTWVEWRNMSGKTIHVPATSNPCTVITVRHGRRRSELEPDYGTLLDKGHEIDIITGEIVDNHS